MLFQEAVDFPHHLRARAGCDTPNAMWSQSISTASSLSPASPRAARGATIPSRRDQMARVGTGGLSVIRGIGGSSTVWPATHS